MDHIDSIKDHNYVSNLQWLTPGENASRSNTGRKRYWSTKVRPIYCVELNKIFSSQSEARRQLGLSAAPLNYALNGKRKTCGDYHWKYAMEIRSRHIQNYLGERKIYPVEDFDDSPAFYLDTEELRSAIESYEIEKMFYGRRH